MYISFLWKAYEHKMFIQSLNSVRMLWYNVFPAYQSMYFHTNMHLARTDITSFMPCKVKQTSVAEHHNQNNRHLLQSWTKTMSLCSVHKLTTVIWKRWKQFMTWIYAFQCQHYQCRN